MYADEVIEAKPPIPTLHHWEVAAKAAGVAWSRWSESYRRVSEDDIKSDVQIECMSHYEDWDPSIRPWFVWCLFLARRRIIDIVEQQRKLNSREIIDSLSTHAQKECAEFPLLELVDETYSRLHPLDQWVIGIRVGFTTRHEVKKYLRLCGMSDDEIHKSTRRIINACTKRKTDKRFTTSLLRACHQELDLLLEKVLEREKLITEDDLRGIMRGMFEYKNRNVCDPPSAHRRSKKSKLRKARLVRE